MNKKRSTQILELVTKHKQIEVTQLAKELNVSQVTMRKDLDELEIPKALLIEIKRLLDKDASLDKLKPHLHVPILLLHECEITSKTKIINKEYLDSIREQYADRATVYFKKQIEKCKDDIFMYSDICFHLMLVPVPNKEEIVNMFINRAKTFR